MNIAQITEWLDSELDLAAFDDVSNNGVQIARDGDDVSKVAFAVDASLASVNAAASAGAQLLVVHHGISWGGGIRRIDGGVHAVVAAAIRANLALYAVHLPLDANEKYGNNYEIARHLGLSGLRPAFSYHGNVIGVVGESPDFAKLSALAGEEVAPVSPCRVGRERRHEDALLRTLRDGDVRREGACKGHGRCAWRCNRLPAEESGRVTRPA